MFFADHLGVGLPSGNPLDAVSFFNGISLTADIGSLITSIDLTGFSYSGDTDLIFLFDKDNALLGTDGFAGSIDATCVAIYGAPSAGACYKYSYSADLSGQGVYKVMFGSESSATYFDTLAYSTVPAPQVIWLLGMGIVLMKLTKRTT